jgi:hypothetical protein
VAIDGKTVRRSHDRSRGQQAIHLVSAWASANSMTLGQVKVERKSNEITAIPKLLGLLALHGCIVTIDAMGCQKEISQGILDRGADYLCTRMFGTCLTGRKNWAGMACLTTTPPR